jgi:signal transduction histidine kinase
MNTSALSAIWSRRPGRSGGQSPLIDACLAAAVVVLQLAGWYAMSSGPGHHGRAAGPLSYLLLALGAVSLLARRRYPAAVLAVAMATTLSAGTLGALAAWLVLIAAFVNAVLFRRRLAAIASLVIGYAVSVWPPWLIGSPGHTPAAVALGLLAGLIALLSAAELSRARGQRAAAVRRSRDEQARRRASEERLAIARDLHDVVAHNISVINVQANTALHLMDRQPERARAALTAIHEVSRQALGELRSVLGVQRADDGAPLAPSPGVDRLDELAAHARSAGIAVRLVKEGPARPLPADVGVAAYRIVQEALTNTVRHSGGRSATVRVRYDTDALTIEVDDDGRAAAAARGTARGAAGGEPSGEPGEPGEPARPGNGIVGMAERARALGGTLDAGPRSEGGFRVLARLPA